MSLPIAQTVCGTGQWRDAVDQCVLSFEARFLRRKVLTTVQGMQLLVDLPQTRSLQDGEAFELSDGRIVAIIAAKEELLQIKGNDLVRLAWHVGNRHTPCQIEADRLLIERTPVIADMLRKLGADVTEVTEAFTPEGGAYGHGRTHGHSHSDIHGASHDSAHAQRQHAGHAADTPHPAHSHD
jgi:urease accessory protein